MKCWQNNKNLGHGPLCAIDTYTFQKVSALEHLLYKGTAWDFFFSWEHVHAKGISKDTSVDVAARAYAFEHTISQSGSKRYLKWYLSRRSCTRIRSVSSRRLSNCWCSRQTVRETKKILKLYNKYLIWTYINLMLTVLTWGVKTCVNNKRKVLISRINTC
jgi:hypothetical protein